MSLLNSLDLALKMVENVKSIEGFRPGNCLSHSALYNDKQTVDSNSELCGC